MTIVGWRLIVFFQLHQTRPCGHRIGSLKWRQLHLHWCCLMHSLIGEETSTPVFQENSTSYWASQFQHNLIFGLVENKISCAFITNIIPSSWCSYLSTRACHDKQHTFPHLIVPCSWHDYNKRLSPLIFDGSLGIPTKRAELTLLHLGMQHN